MIRGVRELHTKLPIMEEKGYVVLKDYDGPEIPEHEFRSLEFMDWKSGGDTNFAPIASAFGEMECGGLWARGKADDDGISNVHRNGHRVLRRHLRHICEH